MRGSNTVSALALGACLALTATAAQAQVQGHEHRKRVHADARDARIGALEDEVRALASEVRDLRADRGRVAQAALTPPASVADSGAGAIVVGQAGPSAPSAASPASTPDTPRPVTTASAAPAAVASILAGKPSIASADGRFAANLHGVMQFDAAHYFQDSAQTPAVDLRRGGASTDTAHARKLSDGTDFRRARIGVDGKAFGDFEYNILFDFGGAGAEDAGHIQELWLQYSGLKPFHMRVGAFRPSEGLEDQGSTNGQPFLERPAGTDVAASISGGDYREGAQLWAAGDRWFASGIVSSRTVGTINTTGSSTAQAFDQALGLVGRVAYLPFKGDDWLTHVGVHGSYLAEVADAGGPDVAVGTARYPVQFRERPELRVDGTRLVDTGAIDASHAHDLGVEVAAQKRSLFVQAEYEDFGIERRNSTLGNPTFSSWYVEGGWLLTGERRKYNTSTFAFDGPPVDHPFDLHRRTWGAVELAVRYSDLNLNYHQGAAGAAIPLDGVRGGEQQILSGAVDWYLNPIVRFILEYQHVDVSRLSPNAVTYATPVGAQVGQKYDTLSIRSQLAF